MVASLPSRIMNYSISPSSPTGELLTLGQIYSEVGDYASTILDREHLSFSRRCVTRLNKVVAELVARQSILTAENLYDMPESEPVSSDLKSLTVDELHNLYRRWPIRHSERCADGRESMSFYYEGRIVRELSSRKAADKGEQLKMDYCTAMYSNELYNMSLLFSCPVQVDTDKIFPDSERRYTTEELTALINLYKNYRDVIEREILVEYVDSALDRVSTDDLGLLVELAELGRKEVIRVPAWVNKKLEEAVGSALASKSDNDAELVLALLTLHIIKNDTSLERKAQRLVNSCYKAVFDGEADLDQRIESLYIAVTCCDYVTRFSVSKAAAAWNELSAQALSGNHKLTPRQTFRLLEVAQDCENYANISSESKYRLKGLLSNMAKSDSTEAVALNEIAKMRF